MATCAVCNSLLKPGKDFCTECGNPTSTRATAPHFSHQGTTAIGIQCTRCGASVPVSKRFCTKCGNPVTLPQRQQPASVAGDIKCAQCGAIVQPGKGLCTQCNARIIRIGRKPDNDVVLDYHMISAHHACIAILGDVATIQDLGSNSGTAIGSPDKKIAKSRVSADDTVYFGSFPIPAARLLSGHLSLGKRAHTLLNLTGQSMVLGRGPDCDVVLDHPLVAYHHARISRAGDAFVVQDLGTRIGTFVNGRRISGSCTVNVGDIVGVGSYTFKFSAANTIQQHDYRGNVTLEARGVTVDVTRKRKRIIQGISLTIYPSEIVASMGPSGAGKTTLMNALNGYMPPTSGTVLINGQDLYANYGQFCGHVGYVPQDDIMHRELTVGQALYYTARLRLPADYGDAEIQTRIQSVLSLLDLDGTEDVIIGSPEKRGISGGQRKRVNLAMELLTDPSILFLDEPTSGLSSEDALMVMKILRNLANQGKTILITIHQPGLEVFRMADSLVMVSKDKRSKEPGQMVYFGPAYPDSVEFFNPGGVPNAKPGVDPSPDEVMRGLSQGKTEDWVRRYAASQHKRQYVDERLGKRPSGSAHPVNPKISREPGLSQWWTLVKRGLAIKAKDRWSTAILLGQAPVIACLLVLAFGNLASNEKAPYLGKTIVTIFLLIISAIWLGCSNAVREVVGEWAVYNRERMVNLKIPSYLASKFTVLGGLCVIQCAILFSIIYVGCSLKGPPFLMFAVLTLASFVGLALGLILSAVAPTSEVAIGLVPLVLLPMIFLGGAMSPLQNMSESTKPITHLIPARWAFEGLLLLENENREFPRNPKEDLSRNPGAVDYFFPEEDRFGTPASAVILGAMLVALIAGIMTVLKIRDIH